jgi:hypothetical protein
MAEHGSVVYYIGARSVCRLKIGVTTNLRARFERLSAQAVDRLEIVATEPGGHADERARHGLFAHLRRHGEWFEWADELDAWLQYLRTPIVDELLRLNAGPAEVFANGVIWLAHSFPLHQPHALRLLDAGVEGWNG